MTASDLALIQWFVPIVLPALSGLIGVVIGAWMSTRRERRDQKRQAYIDVLRVLTETYEAARALAIIDRENLSDIRGEILTRANEINLRRRQALAIAQITLGREAADVLIAFDEEWRGAAAGPKDEIARRRQQAADRVVHDLLEAARRELKT